MAQGERSRDASVDRRLAQPLRTAEVTVDNFGSYARVSTLPAARHLRGDIYEVRSSGDRVAYRVLFAVEGARGQVLLALEAFKKKTQKTPPATIALAERRLRDWRARAPT